MRMRSRLCLFAALGVGTAAHAAAAQSLELHTPRLDASLGVTLGGPADVNQRPQCTDLGLPCISPKTIPDPGLVMQVGLNAAPYTALVGELSEYENMWVPAGANRSIANHVTASLAGIRLSTGVRVLAFERGVSPSGLSNRRRADTTRYRAFVQLLAGPEASTVVATRTALQPGVGFDGKLGWAPGWIRVAYDYRYTRGGQRNLSGGRVLCGLVVASP
jgi:hypothetical protein